MENRKNLRVTELQRTSSHMAQSAKPEAAVEN